MGHGKDPLAEQLALVLRGYVAFLDPPKDTAARALDALHKHGVAVKILTGDNHLISRKVCKDAVESSSSAGIARNACVSPVLVTPKPVICPASLMDNAF